MQYTKFIGEGCIQIGVNGSNPKMRYLGFVYERHDCDRTIGIGFFFFVIYFTATYYAGK